MQRYKHSLVGSLVLAACLAAPAAQAEDGVGDDSIVIGTTNPLTGNVASACKPVSDGALAWFAKINADGGVHGRTIDNRVLDDQYQAPVALANARSFMREGIFALFGGCGTIQPAAVFPVMEENGIPYLFPYAGLESFVVPTKRHLFAMMAINRDQITGLINTVIPEMGLGTVAGLYTKYPGVEEAIVANQQAVEAIGSTWTEAEHITPGGTDFTPIVLKLKQLNPDYLILNIVEPDAGRLFLAMEAQNWWPKKMIGVSALSNGALFDAMGETLDGKLITAAPTLPPSAPEAADCVTALQAANVAVSGFSLFGCGTAQAFVHAVEQAGPELTRARLVEVLESWSDEPASQVFPPVTFTADNHMGQVKMVRLGVAGGKASAEGYFDTPMVPAQ